MLPELMVVVTFLVGLVSDLVSAPERRRNTGYICLLGLVIALALAVQQNDLFVSRLGTGSPLVAAIFSGMVVFDQFGTLFRILLITGTIISLLLALHARELNGPNHGEFLVLMVAVCAGGLFLASSTNLLMIYLALETLSVISYALAGFLRRDRKSAEAGIKYMVYGAMASAIMLFGMSYLYGLTGSLDLAEVARKFLAINQAGRGALAIILILFFCGFLYKIAAVPFHYWSPDVYEGAPTAATGFFSVVPKAAGFAVLIRALCAFFPLGSAGPTWLPSVQAEHVIAVLAVATMVVGNLAALGQSDAKRMLAYSSIAHAGYMLAGLSVLDDHLGAAAVVFYLIVYLLMNLGAFLVLIALENVCGGCDLSQLRGAVRREPLLCVTLCIFLFSLIGLPPLGGFIGKYLIMLKLAGREHYGMVIWIGLNSVVSLYYYMRLAKAVVIDQPEGEATAAERAPVTFRALAVCQAAALLALFVYFEPVQRLCTQALAPLR